MTGGDQCVIKETRDDGMVWQMPIPKKGTYWSKKCPYFMEHLMVSESKTRFWRKVFWWV